MPKKIDSEYGGSAGRFQPAVAPDGGEGHIQLTAGEKRALGATYIKRMAGVDPELPLGDLHRPQVDEILAEVEVRANGRDVSESYGDSVS